MKMQCMNRLDEVSAILWEFSVHMHILTPNLQLSVSLTCLCVPDLCLCPWSVSIFLVRVLGPCPRSVSPVRVPVRVPGTCPRSVSPVRVPGLYPGSVSLVSVCVQFKLPNSAKIGDEGLGRDHSRQPYGTRSPRGSLYCLPFIIIHHWSGKCAIACPAQCHSYLCSYSRVCKAVTWFYG